MNILSVNLIVVCGVVLALDEESKPSQRFQKTETHMATSINIELYAADEVAANRGFEAAFARIASLDQAFSDYQPDSELTRLSESSPHPQPVRVSDDLWEILSRGQAISERSDGAFDVTVGPLTKLWRRSRRQKQLPAPNRLDAARQAVGFRKLRLDPDTRTVQLLHPHMRLDLGGIAQGYAADEAIKVLREHGIRSALVNASGDITAADPPPGQEGWLVGLSGLDAQAAPARFIRIANRAVSTSGDLFQFVEIDGVRYSHIVDPRTGIGLTDRCSVTIIATDGTLADALATAVCVLGPKAGIELAEQSGVEAMATFAVDGKTETIETKKFRDFTEDRNRQDDTDCSERSSRLPSGHLGSGRISLPPG